MATSRASLKSARRRLACCRLARVRLAPLSLAFCRLARSRLAWRRSAPLRSAPARLIRRRSWLARFAPRRSAFGHWLSGSMTQPLMTRRASSSASAWALPSRTRGNSRALIVFMGMAPAVPVAPGDPGRPCETPPRPSARAPTRDRRAGDVRRPGRAARAVPARHGLAGQRCAVFLSHSGSLNTQNEPPWATGLSPPHSGTAPP